MSEKFDIIVSGHFCIDLIPDMKTVRRDVLNIPGYLAEVGPIILSNGGAVSNTGLALHRLGIKVGLMSVVGDDMVGKITIDALRRIDPSLTTMIRTRSGQASSYTIVLSPMGSDRTFLHCPGINATFGVADVDFALLGQVKIFHMGYPPLLPGLTKNDGEELYLMYKQAKETGVITSMDTALPDPEGESGRVDWKGILKRSLPYVDIFLPSIEEIMFAFRRADFFAWRHDIRAHLTQKYLAVLADELIDMGVVIAGFKLGELGIYMKTADAPAFQRLESLGLDVSAWANVALWIPAFQIELATATGAGDSAYAGLLAALLHGMSPHDTLRWACAVGACCCEAPDANSGVRSWNVTAARLQAGWASRPEVLPD